ncbi:MAG: maltose alpha-D-glucosyltransferase [Proteobacteria bacterium]|nr:maltose alpha-D-glucosyltransferase [Pseudomonadota bacterium]
MPSAALAEETRADVAHGDDAGWYLDAVIYQLNVKAYVDSDGDGVGDFKGVTSKLDYVKDLGVNTIWLMPFYPSPLKDDGYDIAEYENVHPQYGTLDDFKVMLDEAHRRGLRVITELVINHTSDQHPWFQAARKAPPGSPERDFYVWSDDDGKYRGTRIIFTDTETSNWTWDPVAKAYYWHRFFSHQPDLNFDNPAVLEAVFRTMRFWLDMGVDGFRLDAIPYLVEREGTNNENLPETHAVIKQLRAAIDASYPNRFLLAEANQWPEDVREYFGDGDECHACYHFPLMPRMYMAIAQEDRYPLVEIMQQTPDIPAGCQWAIFLRNHDELTLEMVTSKERDYMYSTYAADPRARINLGIRRRLGPLLENDKDRIKLMNSLLLSMRGSPIIYYGDEIGMGDNVFVGDRNGVRTPMQWSPDRNAGFSRADPQRLYLPPIMDAIYGYEAVNVEAQLRDASSLLHWMRRMLAVRATSRAFGRGGLQFLKPGNRKVLAYLREHDGETILCVANLSRSAQPVELDLGAFKGRVPIELLGRTSFPPIGELPYLLTLAGYGFYWFRLATDVAVPSWHDERPAIEDRPVLVLFDGWTSLFRDHVVPWRIGLSVKTRSQYETDTLPRHVETQRWYGAKGTAIQRCRVADHAIWDEGDSSWLVQVIETDAGDETASYFVPLTLAWEDRDEERVKSLANAAVARVRQQAEVGIMADALADEAFCRALVRGIGKGGSLATEHGELRFEPTRLFSGITGDDLAGLPVGKPLGHSSNSVVLFGERLFLKAYRRVQPGTNPEVEMGRFLTEVAAFPNCVPLAGIIELRTPEGAHATLGILQAQVPNQGDGWEHAAGYLQRFFESARSGLQALPDDVHAAYMEQVATLGRRTAELHAALARKSGLAAFDPEPYAEADLAAARTRATATARSALALLERQLPLLTGDALAAARVVLGARQRIEQQLTEAAIDTSGMQRTRIHGDYHLSQVLLVKNDFVIIDFEGEPGHSFEERRMKQSPLRDVAGMLRSFGYAAAQGLRSAAPAAQELASLAPLAQAWEDQARRTFVEAYQAAGGPAARGNGAASQLLAFFELEKALYELRYELQNRPDWAAVPLVGICALLGIAPSSR